MRCVRAIALCRLTSPHLRQHAWAQNCPRTRCRAAPEREEGDGAGPGREREGGQARTARSRQPPAERHVRGGSSSAFPRPPSPPPLHALMVPNPTHPPPPRPVCPRTGGVLNLAGVTATGNAVSGTLTVGASLTATGNAVLAGGRLDLGSSGDAALARTGPGTIGTGAALTADCLLELGWGATELGVRGCLLHSRASGEEARIPKHRKSRHLVIGDALHLCGIPRLSGPQASPRRAARFCSAPTRRSRAQHPRR